MFEERPPPDGERPSGDQSPTPEPPAELDGRSTADEQDDGRDENVQDTDDDMDDWSDNWPDDWPGEGDDDEE